MTSVHWGCEAVGPCYHNGMVTQHMTMMDEHMTLPLFETGGGSDVGDN